MPTYKAVGLYQIRISVSSSAGLPSTGKYDLNPDRDDADVHTGSSR
ncbi:MAG: hypothetical protein ABGX30_00860 [bacterium]